MSKLQCCEGKNCYVNCSAAEIAACPDFQGATPVIEPRALATVLAEVQPGRQLIGAASLLNYTKNAPAQKA